jgi:hypothetical protein
MKHKDDSNPSPKDTNVELTIDMVDAGHGGYVYVFHGLHGQLQAISNLIGKDLCHFSNIIPKKVLFFKRPHSSTMKSNTLFVDAAISEQPALKAMIGQKIEEAKRRYELERLEQELREAELAPSLPSSDSWKVFSLDQIQPRKTPRNRFSVIEDEDRQTQSYYTCNLTAGLALLKDKLNDQQQSNVKVVFSLDDGGNTVSLYKLEVRGKAALDLLNVYLEDPVACERKSTTIPCAQLHEIIRKLTSQARQSAQIERE